MALKTIAFQDLLMAPLSVHPRIAKAEVILAFLAPVLIPVEGDGTANAYRPGFLEILPFANRGRLTSVRAHLAKRIYRMPQVLPGLVLLLCFTCLLILDLIYLGNCGDLFTSYYPGCPSSILGEPLVQITLEAGAVAAALLVVVGIAMSFDPRVQSEAWVTMPEELLTLLRRAREAMVAVARTKTLDERESGFAQAAGKSFTSSSAGALGKALAGPFGELLATFAADSALEKDSDRKLQEWKQRTRAEIRLHAAQAILDHHRALTGRAPVEISEAAFASGETWINRHAAAAGGRSGGKRARDRRPPNSPNSSG